jgi:hypothetical protein
MAIVSVMRLELFVGRDAGAEHHRALPTADEVCLFIALESQ